MKNQTYELYGKVLSGTEFATAHSEKAYIPYSSDFSLLSSSSVIGDHTVPNRIEYQPMEGQDADLDGSPTEQTFYRYKKLAEGGAGLIWVEAVSVCQEGKSNPYQLCITEKNLHLYKILVDLIKNTCYETNGYYPVVIIQLNHSGRYSKPDGKPDPITAYFNPDIEKEAKKTASDEYVSSLVPVFLKSALLSAEAGFDGVDIKCCHGYLMSELLSAYDRDGIYGGSFENRSRFFSEVTKTVFSALPSDIIKTARVNIFDGFDGKYTFCAPKNDKNLYDLTEAHELIRIFKKNGGQLLNVTMGSPYRNPDVSRPYKKGLDTPKSDAIFALYRLWRGASEIKEAHPEIKIVNTGISLLGDLSPFAAAGAIKDNMTDYVGFGRMSFAYPLLARDILSGSFDPKMACVACGGCSTLKKNVLRSGCIIRNDYYREIFKEFRKKEEEK